MGSSLETGRKLLALDSLGAPRGFREDLLYVVSQIKVRPRVGPAIDASFAHRARRRNALLIQPLADFEAV